MPAQPKFKTVIRRARFSTPGFSADQMVVLGQSLLDDVKSRMLRAQDINDIPLPPLKPGYAKQKNRRYPPAIRDFRYTGRTLRGLRVLRTSANKALIGFYDPVAAHRAAINNHRRGIPLQFGVSPKNRENIKRVIETALRAPAASVKIA